MALDFPSNPVDGEIFGSYIWSASKGVWQAREESAAPAITSPVPPANPNSGDIWFDSSDGISYVYYDDGNSGSWVEMISSGVTSLALKADKTYVDSQDALKANLSGASFTGNITASYGGQSTRISLGNTTAGSDQYLSGITFSNDTGYKVSHFLNSSTRTTDGGANGYTIRNDGGPLNLGHSSYNTNIYGLVTMPNRIAFSATANYGTNYAGSLNPVIFGIVDININNNYNSTNGRFTASVAGNYFFMSQGHRNANNGYTTIRLRKNGTIFSNSWNASAGSDTLSCGGIIYLAVNDYVDVQMETSQNNYMAENYWKFMGHLIG